MTKAGEDRKSDSNYRVLARKYRPQSFADLIGQEPMVRTLSNAFETGRIAQAYMLTGVRGVGKTTTARILARALNFKSADIDQPSIDLEELGENCQSIMDGNHLDVIEMDAASHTGIDDIRDLIESAQYKPASARYKVYIIDEVHMLSRNAFNGLLKTLEEPPEHLKFIFATTEIRKVPVTVLSRCQRFDLRRINSEMMSGHLQSIAGKENVEIDAGAVAMIVRASEGSVRDALSLMDQAIAHGAGPTIDEGNIGEEKSGDESSAIKITAESVRSMLGLADRARIIDLFEHLMKGDVAACLDELGAQYDVGAEPGVVLSDLADFIHFVTRLKYVPRAADDPAISESESKKGTQFAASLSVRVLGRAWQILLKGIEEVKSSERPLMAAEMVLVRLAHAATLPTPDEIIRSIEGNNKSSGVKSPGAGNKQTGTAVSSAGSPQTYSATGSPGAGDGNIPTVGLSSEPGARMTGTNGPQLSIVSNLPNSEPVEAEAKPQIVLNRFEELIYLAEDKRDLPIKNGLRRHVQLVNFEDGRIEFSITGTPRVNFVGDLQQRLKSWTGKRWNVIISREKGAPSLEEVEQAEERKKFDSASADPAVEAILARYPGSKVIDVRIREDDESQIDPCGTLADGSGGANSGGEDADGLDDFFE